MEFVLHIRRTRERLNGIVKKSQTCPESHLLQLILHEEKSVWVIDLAERTCQVVCEQLNTPSFSLSLCINVKRAESMSSLAATLDACRFAFLSGAWGVLWESTTDWVSSKSPNTLFYIPILGHSDTVIGTA